MHVRLIAAGLLAMLMAACRGSGPAVTPASVTPAPSRTATVAVPTAAPTPVPPPPFDPQSFRPALERVAGGFAQPTFVTHSGDHSGRLFVVERAGTIRILQSGNAQSQVFLDIRSLVGDAGQEQGLLGLAFHPQFAQNGRFFVYYTAANAANGDNTVAEYRVSGDPNRADPASGRVLLAIPDFAPNHNGGMLTFGPDGYLYVGTGDGGGAGDPQRNGQNRAALLAKILRLDVDHGQPYAIPPDNPFAGSTDARLEVWAYGLRNPWRFSFDRATNDLWIADVGQNAWEEVDVQPAGSRGGQNYGWSVMEGNHCFRPSSGCDTAGLVLPVAEYGHDEGCSITGGYVYRGRREPALAGAYFFGDYCSGRIWALYRQGNGWRQVELLNSNVAISSFGEDEAGELYLTGLDDGAVYRLTAGGG